MANGHQEKLYRNFSALKENAGRPAVLVFGGTNFMGKAFVEELVRRSCRICLVNRGRSHWGVTDPSGGRAARVSADRRYVEEFAVRVREATRRFGGVWDLVADFSAFDGPDVRASLEGLGSATFKVYVYISSDSVYEVSTWAADRWKPPPRSTKHQNLEVSESTAVRPPDAAAREMLQNADSYGHGKLEAEEILLEKMPLGARCIFLRLPDVIGPFDGTFRLWAYWHWLRAAEEGAPPPQVQSFKRKGKRPPRGVGDGDAACEKFDPWPMETDPDPPLALVFSHDVVRFITKLLDHGLPAGPPCDAVNLCCSQQMPLSEVLALLARVSGLGHKRPRLVPDKNPKTFLPSVDRPWPLSLKRASDTYGFEPTPLEEVLQSCVCFFQEGCVRFPKQARRAAKKLPADSADLALKCARLDRVADSSESS